MPRAYKKTGNWKVGGPCNPNGRKKKVNAVAEIKDEMKRAIKDGKIRKRDKRRAKRLHRKQLRENPPQFNSDIFDSSDM